MVNFMCEIIIRTPTVARGDSREDLAEGSGVLSLMPVWLATNTK